MNFIETDGPVPRMLRDRCPYCSGALHITKLTCGDCGLGLEGEFPTPRLSRLDAEEQRFVELFVVASGSLKHTAELLGVSYPTVRGRLDRLIARLREQQERDADRRRQILEDIEAGRIGPKRGMRIIESL